VETRPPRASSGSLGCLGQDGTAQADDPARRVEVDTRRCAWHGIHGRRLVRVLESDIVIDVTVIATAAISGGVGLTAALMQMLTNFRQTDAERDRHTADAKAQRRSERQAAYISAMDLLVDFGWDSAFPGEGYNVVESFNKPFLHAANRVRLYGSPAAVAAIDQIQEGLAAMNRTDSAAQDLFNKGANAFTIAARDDVGPRTEDELKDVNFQQGIGPSAD